MERCEATYSKHRCALERGHEGPHWCAEFGHAWADDRIVTVVQPLQHLGEQSWGLEGKRVPCGTPLQLVLHRRWVACRYEQSNGEPRLYVGDGVYVAGDVAELQVRLVTLAELGYGDDRESGHAWGYDR